jgi:hypothetical protein
MHMVHKEAVVIFASDREAEWASSELLLLRSHLKREYAPRYSKVSFAEGICTEIF